SFSCSWRYSTQPSGSFPFFIVSVGCFSGFGGLYSSSGSSGGGGGCWPRLKSLNLTGTFSSPSSISSGESNSFVSGSKPWSTVFFSPTGFTHAQRQVVMGGEPGMPTSQSKEPLISLLFSFSFVVCPNTQEVESSGFSPSLSGP